MFILYRLKVTGIKMNYLTVGSLLNTFHAATQVSKYKLLIKTNHLKNNSTTHPGHTWIVTDSHWRKNKHTRATKIFWNTSSDLYTPFLALELYYCSACYLAFGHHISIHFINFAEGLYFSEDLNSQILTQPLLNTMPCLCMKLLFTYLSVTYLP